VKPLIRLTIITMFLAPLLIAPRITRPALSVAQTKTEPRFFCNYGEGNRGAELCAKIQGRNFEPNEHAERAVDMIVKPLGLRRNFVLVSCPYIENAAAVTYEDGVRYIVYDNAFMESIDRGANTNWASVSILAHEIGHHLQGHTTRLVHHPLTKEERRQSRENELEADEFSGFAMFKLGRTLSEAQAAMKTLRDVTDEELSDHPKKWRRLEAIKRGYEDAMSQSTQAPTPRKSTIAVVIDDPPNRSKIGYQECVHGRTPFWGWKHYIVINPLQDGFPLLIQKPVGIVSPIIVKSDGTWEGKAIFGGLNDDGIGKQWSISVIATKSSLSEGILFHFPEDAKFSNKIIVTRTHSLIDCVR
jgi:hypothetical protein